MAFIANIQEFIFNNLGIDLSKRRIFYLGIHEDFQGLDKITDIVEPCILKIIDIVLAIHILHLDDEMFIRFVYLKDFRNTYMLISSSTCLLLFFSLQVEAIDVFRVMCTLIDIQIIAVIDNIYLAATMTFYLYFHKNSLLLFEHKKD